VPGLRAGHLILSEPSVPHKFHVGASVHYEGDRHGPGARGICKIVRQLPVERDNKLMYRIKNATENFERIAEEHQLKRVD
jgi:hypothetical protein